MLTNYEKASKMAQKEPPRKEVNPWLALAQGIVYQAILDWRILDSDRELSKISYTTLRSFFRSPWCESLLLFTDIDPEVIVARLEAQTKEATL